MDPDLPPEPIKMPQTLEEAIAAKEEWRRRMRALPFPEKIRRLVELQKRRAPIVARWGKVQKIWQLPPHDPALTGNYGGNDCSGEEAQGGRDQEKTLPPDSSH